MLGVLWGLFITIIFTIVLFLINPILGVLGIVWFIGVGIYAWKKNN